MTKEQKKNASKKRSERKEPNLKDQNSALKKIIRAMKRNDEYDVSSNASNPKIKNDENTKKSI